MDRGLRRAPHRVDSESGTHHAGLHVKQRRHRTHHHRTGENPENQTGSLGLQLLVLVSAPHFNGPEGWKPTSDLTGSGHSVWILQTSRGEDGYELFYDDFARHASFSWQYH